MSDQVGPAPAVLHEVPWRRLDAKMLLVHPVAELSRLAIPLLALVFVGSGGIDVWHSAVVAIPVLLGLWRWFTTEFRITPEHLELRSGLIGRRVTRARLDKVRTVALDASPIHRVLSLTKVRIGTGDDEGLELNALSTTEARALRSALLHRGLDAAAAATAPVGGPAATPVPVPGPPSEVSAAAGPVVAPGPPLGPALDPGGLPATDEVLLRFDPRWLRLAPFTGTGVVLAAGAAAVGFGPLQAPAGRAIDASADHADGVPVLPLVLGGLVLLVVVLVVLAIAGYALTNWGFTFSRDRGGRSWHVRHGLLTVKETSIDTSRVRGFSVCRGAGLRLVGGGSARVLVTGLKEERERDGQGSTPITPAAPYPVVRGLLLALLGDDDALDAPLRPHTARARRRQVWRPLRPWALLAVLVVVVDAAADGPWWVGLLPLVLLPLVPLVALDRFRGLGHLLTTHHLVIGMPKVSRHRHALLRRGIIGWQLRQTWFQRRARLVTLVATTAAGSKTYPVVDVTEAAAVPLAADAVPGLLDQFLA